jgi:catechol 2,3-dioxygenase-like lactoylglutathione lyase family enzyme
MKSLITHSLKPVLVAILVLLSIDLYSQNSSLEIIGKSFMAINASNADSLARWYEDLFGLKLLKEIKTADGSAHIRIEGNESLMVEILQVKESRTLTDCGVRKEDSYMLRGYFKVGLWVRDIQKVAEYFKSRGVSFKHDVFGDKDTAMRSFILEDPSGNLLQFLQHDPGVK